MPISLFLSSLPRSIGLGRMWEHNASPTACISTNTLGLGQQLYHVQRAVAAASISLDKDILRITILAC